MLRLFKECREAGIGIKGRPAQPVDRSVAADQRCGFAIADQPVILDTAGHGYDPLRERSRVAVLSAAMSTAEVICSMCGEGTTEDRGIVGDNAVICVECVWMCADILEERGEKRPTGLGDFDDTSKVHPRGTVPPPPK